MKPMANASTPIINRRVRFMRFPLNAFPATIVWQWARPYSLGRWLLHGTGDVGEHVIRVGANQANGTNNNNENNRQHDRILGNVLSLLFAPKSARKLFHCSLLTKANQKSQEMAIEAQIGPPMPTLHSPDRVIIPCILRNSDKF